MYLSEVMKVLGVSRATVRYWAKVGRIRTSKGITTHKLIYWDEDVWALVGKRFVRDHKIVAYCRVDGTTERKGDHAAPAGKDQLVRHGSRSLH